MRHISVDWPHLAFATAISGWAAWYCRDAWLANADAENLILIVPVSAAALVLYGVVALGCIRRTAEAVPRPPVAAFGRILGTMAMLAGFAVAGPLIGFDVVSFVYLLAMLLFLGERRWAVLLLVPVIFAAIVVWGFGTLLDTPLPLLLFGDGS